jgi:lsr operon transcriptional repressor
MKRPGLHREEEDFQVRTAWLYYVEGMTQNAIAEHLGVTRLRVNRAIQDAVQNGIVRINISSKFTPCLELEKKIKERFGLKHVLVAPSPVEDANATKIVGTELGKYLGTILGSKHSRLFGIGWGVTLNHAVRTILPTKRHGLEIISVLGGLPRGSEFNSFGVCSLLAEALSAQCTYLTLPLYSSSKRSRDIILVQDVFKEVFNKIKRADGIAAGVGDMTRKSLLIKDGLPADIKLAELKEAGAVGDVLGYFLNSRGELVDHPVNDRVLGLNPFEFSGIENRIVAAGGAYKKDILLATLRSGIFNILITDQRAAEHIVRQTGSKKPQGNPCISA